MGQPLEGLRIPALYLRRAWLREEFRCGPWLGRRGPAASCKDRAISNRAWRRGFACSVEYCASCRQGRREQGTRKDFRATRAADERRLLDCRQEALCLC